MMQMFWSGPGACRWGVGESARVFFLTPDFHSSTSKGPTSANIHHSGRRRRGVSGRSGGNCTPDEANKSSEEKFLCYVSGRVQRRPLVTRMPPLIDHRRALILSINTTSCIRTKVSMNTEGAAAKLLLLLYCSHISITQHLDVVSSVLDLVLAESESRALSAGLKKRVTGPDYF